jgi:hypothetical protein
LTEAPGAALSPRVPFLYALDHLPDRLLRGFGQQNQKLVTAPAAEDIAGASALPEGFGRLLPAAWPETHWSF